MENNNPLDSTPYLHSYCSSTYQAEFDAQVKKMEDISDSSDKVFYFGTAVKAIVANAMFELEACKSEMQSLYWRYQFTCHPGEERILEKEIQKVKENIRDLQNLIYAAQRHQPRI